MNVKTCAVKFGIRLNNGGEESPVLSLPVAARYGHASTTYVESSFSSMQLLSESVCLLTQDTIETLIGCHQLQ